MSMNVLEAVLHLKTFANLIPDSGDTSEYIVACYLVTCIPIAGEACVYSL